MKVNWKNLIISIAIPLAIGALSALLTRKGMKDFQTINQPPLAPPMWLFPIVWTCLFVLMGIASYLIIQRDFTLQSLLFYALQLIFNFFWSIWFFNFGWYFFSFLWILCLWALILATTISFYKIYKPAGYLLLPYLFWVTFAAYLNLGIYFYN